MTILEIGTIEEVGLREIWPREDENFTPWLAENLDVLGDALGLQLELRDTEVPTGQYFLDILAEEAEGGNVAIENQLKRWTDHKQLGKLLTYAAWHEAEYLVLVAPQFTAEHRAAIVWLNRLAPDKVWFYGVVVCAIKIGDSQTAADFRVVADPKTQKTDSQRYYEFFQPLVTQLPLARFTEQNQASAQYHQEFDPGVETSGGKMELLSRRR